MCISFAQITSALWCICIARMRADFINQGDTPYLSSAEVYGTYIHITGVRSDSINQGDNPYLSSADVLYLLCTCFYKFVGAHDIARQWLHSGYSSLQLYFLNPGESQITFKVVLICIRPPVLSWTHFWHRDKLKSLASENYFWVFPMSNQIWELRLTDKIKYMKLLQKPFHYHLLNCQWNKRNGMDRITTLHV